MAYILRYYPVIVAWATSGGLALLLGDWVHLTSTQEAAVTTIVVALAALFTWWKTTPHTVSGFTGALTTLTVAAGAFGLHLTTSEIGFGVAIISAIVGLLLHQTVTPTAGSPPAKPAV